MSPFHLDLPTLIAAMCVVSISAGVALLLAGYLHLPVRGLRFWAVGYLVTGVGLALTVLRGSASPLLAIVLGNTMVSGGYLLVWLGARRLRGGSVSMVFVVVPLAATVAAMASFLGDGNTSIRVAFMSLITAGLTGLTAWEFSHPAVRQSVTAKVLAALFAAHGLFYTARALAAVSATAEPMLFPTGILGVPTFIEGFIWMIVTGFGLVVLTSEVLHAELRRQATRDPLTNLYNRRAFAEAAERELARARRHGRMPAFLLLDLDHFKLLNDTHGHEAGDRVLEAFAAAASADLRACDVLARFGGEEFVLMLAETDLSEALRVAERIRAGTADLAVSGRSGVLATTVSIGVAIAEVGEVELAATLHRADEALYKAKLAGRNRTIAAQPSTQRAEALTMPTGAP